jgi:hypothetical protein
MKHERSNWYTGLLFAEEQDKMGWTFKGIDCVEEHATWNLEGTEGVQVVFGEFVWLDGVRDYYKCLRETK